MSFKQLLSSVDVREPILKLIGEFLLEISSLFGFHLCQKSFSWVKKRFLTIVFQRIIPFWIYNHLFFLDRGLSSVCDLRVKVVIQEKTVYNLFGRKMSLTKEIFSPRFYEVYLTDMMSMFVCQRRFESSDTFYGHYTQEVVESPYFLFKIYLEVLFRVFLVLSDKKYILFFLGFLCETNLERQRKKIWLLRFIPWPLDYANKRAKV